MSSSVGENNHRKNKYFYPKGVSSLAKMVSPSKRGELEMGDWIQMAVSEKGTARVYPLADAYVNINYARDIEIANQLLEK